MNRKSLLLLVVLLVILGGCNNSFENPKEQAAPTSVPTLTRTLEPTSMPTPTLTNTPVATPTNTPTPTPEPTSTPTPSPTNTPTPTSTPTPSPTNTPTPTSTPTPSPTNTPTPKPTNTPTPTSTPTPSPTNTPTPTPEPTNTPTPTPTNTPTPTPEPTNTPTPSPTPITGSKYLENDKVVICTKDKDDFIGFQSQGRKEINELFDYVEVLPERTLEDYTGTFVEYHAGTIRFDSAATVELLKKSYDILLYNARKKIESIYPIFVEKESIAVSEYIKDREFQAILDNKDSISITKWANMVAMEDGEPFFAYGYCVTVDFEYVE